MAAERRSYEFVLNSFGAEVVSDRVDCLHERMQSYLDARGMGEIAFVDEDLLHHAVLDYFADIQRLKDFHGIDLANKNKIVAYEAHWILRRKPIQLVKGRRDDTDASWYLNESFLTTLIAQECLSPYENEPLGDSLGVLRDYLDHLLYHLKYRSADAQSLELVIDAFSTGLSVGRSLVENGKVARAGEGRGGAPVADV